jgi:DNA-binding response OmpR family regulator
LARLLLVDDDESVRSGLGAVLEAHQFDVVTAAGVSEALQRIATEHFDVLLSDLHMPGDGDGLTVVSAMRHANPAAVALLLSANPDMARAAAAIVQQADQVIRKPFQIAAVIDIIRQRLAGELPPAAEPAPETVSTFEPIPAILERETPAITLAWLDQLAHTAQASNSPAVRVTAPALTAQERVEHLPEALRDILFRLRYPQPVGSTSVFSMTALQHGARRRRQGAGAATLVEESRALQAALFQTIESKLDRIDPAQLPAALMAIADEVNAQLAQALTGYENEQPAAAHWGFK